MTEASGDAPTVDPPVDKGSAEAQGDEKAAQKAGVQIDDKSKDGAASSAVAAQVSSGDAQPSASGDMVTSTAAQSEELQSTVGETPGCDTKQSPEKVPTSMDTTEKVPISMDTTDVDIFQVSSGWDREEIEEMQEEGRRAEEEEAMALMAGQMDDDDDDMAAALEQQAAALANGPKADNGDPMTEQMEELQRLIKWQQDQLNALPTGKPPKHMDVDEPVQPLTQPHSAEDWAALRALMSPAGSLSPNPPPPNPLPPPVPPGVVDNPWPPQAAPQAAPQPKQQALGLPPPQPVGALPDQVPVANMGGMPMDFNSGPSAAMTPEDLLQAAQNHHGLDPAAPPRSKVCIFYLTGACRHGFQCQNRHPPEAECSMMKSQYKRRNCRFADACQMGACLYWHPRDGQGPFNDGGAGIPMGSAMPPQHNMATPPGLSQQRVFMMNY